MNRFVPYSYEDNIARTYYGTVNISYESALSRQVSVNGGHRYLDTNYGLNGLAPPIVVYMNPGLIWNNTNAQHQTNVKKIKKR